MTATLISRVANYFGDDVSVLSNNCPVLACGQPRAGSCFVAHSGPGCDDLICCEAVCAVDPFCCQTQWDGICVGEAKGICATIPPCPNPVETNVLRSGQVNGVPGIPCDLDDDITYAPTLINGCNGLPLTLPPLFGLAASLSAPKAVVVQPYTPVWLATLPSDPDARWVNFEASPVIRVAVSPRAALLPAAGGRRWPQFEVGAG